MADLDALGAGSVEQLTMPHKFERHAIGYWYAASLCQQLLRSKGTPPTGLLLCSAP